MTRLLNKIGNHI